MRTDIVISRLVERTLNPRLSTAQRRVTRDNTHLIYSDRRYFSKGLS